MEKAQPYVAPPPPQKMSTDPYAQTGSATDQWLLRRPPSSDTRLILDFFPDSWCGTAIVLDDDVLTQVPPQLAARGISQQEWTDWMARFKHTVNKNNMSCGCCFTLALLTVTAPIVCCVLSKHHRDIEQFNEDINKQVFEPRCMLWKTQGSSISFPIGDDRSYTEDVQWIAISLTSEDAQQLRKDGHTFSGFGPSHREDRCCASFCKTCCCCGQYPQY